MTRAGEARREAKNGTNPLPCIRRIKREYSRTRREVSFEEEDASDRSVASVLRRMKVSK